MISSLRDFRFCLHMSICVVEEARRLQKAAAPSQFCCRHHVAKSRERPFVAHATAHASGALW